MACRDHVFWCCIWALALICLIYLALRYPLPYLASILPCTTYSSPDPNWPCSGFVRLPEVPAHSASWSRESQPAGALCSSMLVMPTSTGILTISPVGNFARAWVAGGRGWSWTYPDRISLAQDGRRPETSRTQPARWNPAFVNGSTHPQTPSITMRYFTPLGRCSSIPFLSLNASASPLLPVSLVSRPVLDPGSIHQRQVTWLRYHPLHQGACQSCRAWQGSRLRCTPEQVWTSGDLEICFW